MISLSTEKTFYPWRRRLRSGPPGNGVEWPSAGTLSRCNRAGARHRRRGRSHPLRTGQRTSCRRAFGWAQLGGKSPARWRPAARRQSPRSLHCRPDGQDRRRRPRQSRQRLCGRTGLTRIVLSRRPLRRHLPRRLSVAGRIRLEQSGTRPGMRERAWTGSRHCRRGTDLLRPGQPSRSCIGRLAALDRVSSVWSPPSNCRFTHAPRPGAPACTCIRSRSPTRCSPGHARSFPSSTTGSSCRSTPGGALRIPGSTNPASRSPARYSPTRRRRRRKRLPCLALARLSIRRSSRFLMRRQLWPIGIPP